MSDSHSTGVGGSGGSEAALDAGDHQVADHLAGDAGGGGVPAEDLAVAGVDGEQQADDAAVAAGDLAVVGTPADVRAERYDRTIVGPAGPAGGVGLQGEAGGAQDAEHALAVDRRLAAATTLAIEQGREPAVAVGRALVDEPAQGGQELGVAGLAVGLPGPALPAGGLDQVGTGHAQRVGDGLHREASSSHELDRKGAFFGRASSRASLRISFSSVFRPSRHSSCAHPPFQLAHAAGADDVLVGGDRLEPALLHAPLPGEEQARRDARAGGRHRTPTCRAASPLRPGEPSRRSTSGAGAGRT